MNARRFASRLAVAVGAAMAISGAPAQATIVHPYISSFGSFANVQGVAVDQSTGDVYVLDTGAGEGSLLRFDAAGNPLKFTGLPGQPTAITGLKGAGGAENEIAVDNSSGPAKGDVYVAVSSSNGEDIDVLGSGGEPLGSLSEAAAPWGETCGVAVGPSGAVYVGVYGGYIDKFVPTSNPVTNADYVSSVTEANSPCNLAVDSDGNAFAVKWNQGPVNRYESSQFGLLTGMGSVVDLAGSTLTLDSANDHLFVDEGGQISEFGAHGEPFQKPVDTFAHTGEGSIFESFGIAVNEVSGDVYVSNGRGKVSVFGSQILPDASLEAAGRSGDTVTLTGSVNPDGVAITQCQFEYSTEGIPLTSVPCTPSPVSNSTPTAVSASLSGLAVGAYSYRLTVSNVNGQISSRESTFVVSGAPSIEEETFSSVGSSSAILSARINANGEATRFSVEYGTTNAYGSTTLSTPIGGGSRAVGVIAHLDGLSPGVTYSFRFKATNEIATTAGSDVTFSTLQENTVGLPDDRGYEMVTPVENEGEQAYAPAGSGVTGIQVLKSAYPFRAAADGHAITYVAEPNAEGNGNEANFKGDEYMATRGPSGGWTQRNIQPPGFESPTYIAFSSDLSTGVLISSESLTAEAPGKYQNIYTRDSADGSLHAISPVKPPNRTPSTFFFYRYASAAGAPERQFFEANDALTPNAHDGGSSEPNIYESVEGELRLVNVLPDGSSEPNASIGAPAGNIAHAVSNDGSRVFWTDENTGALYVRDLGQSTVLIGDHARFATASADGSRVLYEAGGDLYEDNLSTGVTKDLTPGGQVLGIVGSSEDAEYVYFVAQGVLASGASAGRNNLYLRHDGSTRLIAILGPQVEGEGEEIGLLLTSSQGHYDWAPSLGQRTAEVTPDGHSLVFMSMESLTGYDNRDQEGKRVGEVYLYADDTDTLTCASCSPSGEQPSTNFKNEPAAYLPVTNNVAYQLRTISEDGNRIIFQSEVPLVPQDVNGVTDVYEWERNGTGSCHLGTGCIYLLSGGLSETGSYLADASADGADVFIVTGGQLVEQDKNDVYDVYDVRIGATQPVSPTLCTGSGCQGVPGVPPIFATPSSATFNGVGNFSPPVKVVNKVKTKIKPKHKVKKRKAKAKKKRRGRGEPKKEARVIERAAKRGRGGR